MPITTSERHQAFEALAQRIVDNEPTQVCAASPTPAERYRKGWRPKLNPTQKQAFHSKAIYMLLHGERGSGKGHVGLNMMVNYLFRNHNSLAYIIIKELGMSTEGGAWDELQRTILPYWQNEIGLEWRASKYDYTTKKPYVYIQNIHGGTSMVMLASLPVANQVEAKVKGRTPEFVLVDEADTLADDRYFSALLMQLGRRTKGNEPSKLVFICNPKGPSHWLYKRFFDLPYDKDTGVHDDRYAEYHIPIQENLSNLPAHYYEDYVLTAIKGDPIKEARLVRGEWIDEPEADALFATYFSSKLHVVGDLIKGEGLLPVIPVPIVVGYDLGQGHSSITFKQVVVTPNKVFKLTFDEIDRVGTWTPYQELVPTIIDRMVEWDKTMDHKFQYVHVSDNSAFNQFRAKDGSFDCKDVEDISRAYVERKGLDSRYIIRMRECPKGAHSIEARVRMVKEDFAQGCHMISATCVNAIRMFEHLPPDPENALKPKPKHRYIHNFDSFSYGDFYATKVKGVVTETFEETKSAYYRIGGG